MRRLIMPLGVLFIGLVVLAGAHGGATTAGAQPNRSLRWDRFDVTIDGVDTEKNRFNVAEAYELTIITGPFSFGTASIPTARMNGIEDVRVYDGGTALVSSCPASRAGQFCARRLPDRVDIRYYFTTEARSGERRQIRITYVAQGALRSYPDGDQLYWVAIPDDLPFPVQAARVTVTLPAASPPEVAQGYLGGYPVEDWSQTIQGSTVTWTSPGPVPRGQAFEARVQYPHNPAMSPPPWQSAFDSRRNFEENIQPLLSLGLLALSVLIAIGGPVLVYIQYARSGRDPEAVVVPEYLTEPPTDDPPGVVGTLVDEVAEMREILATLIDLARRGYLVIEQTRGGGLLSTAEFQFHRTDKAAEGLAPYESTLLHALFGRSTSTSLSDLRNRFYIHIPTLRQALYRAVVERGYFPRSPETTRNIWVGAGAGVLMLAVMGIVGLTAIPEIDLLQAISPFLLGPFIALLIPGLVMLIAASYMPAKTARGAQEAARWRAFRTYLQNIRRYVGDDAQVDELFERYTPYAVAFGIDSQWTRQMTPILRSMPEWYHPTYIGGRWHGGYRRGTWGGSRGGGLGDMGGLSGSNRDLTGGLNDMSRGLTDGLNAMSSGLSSMLNDASRVFNSRPSSSGSGGRGGGGFSGGGFSGGGFSGGGGSGGGSRGFG